MEPNKITYRKRNMTLIEFCTILSMLLTALHLVGFDQITWFHCFLPMLFAWAVGGLLLVGALILIFILWIIK